MTKECTDHLGNTYPSFHEMCNHYMVSEPLFYMRRKKGCSLEECLKPPIRKEKAVTDHLGATYVSIQAMCSHYGIPYHVYNDRMKRGWKQSDALTIKSGHYLGIPKKSLDHLGNEYSSIKDLCAHYGITPTVFTRRMKDGWDLERALTVKQRPGRGRPPKTYQMNGLTFQSLEELCEAYGCDSKVIRSRLQKGWKLEDAIKMPAPPTP